MKVTEQNNDKKSRPAGMSRVAKIIAFVASLFCSLLIWIYAIGYDSTLFEETFSGIQVEVQGEDVLELNQGYTLAWEQSFSSVTVVAQGKRSELNALSAEDFRAVVDVSKASGAGEQTLKITVISPNGIEIVSQSSSTVTVFVDEFTQRNEPLTVSVRTNDDYESTPGEFISQTIYPKYVNISGPKSVLDNIDKAVVNFVLNGDDSEGYGNVQLVDVNGGVIDNPYVTISDNTARVEGYFIKEKDVIVDIAFVGGEFSADDDGVEYTLSSNTIKVSGKPGDLDGFDKFLIEIDETEIDATWVDEMPISPKLPAGIKNISGFDKIIVNVILPDEATREFTIPADRITVENLPEGFDYEIKNDLKITVRGALDAIDAIDPSLITAKADYKNVSLEDGVFVGKVNVEFGFDTHGFYVQNKEKNKVSFSVIRIPTEPDNGSADAPVTDIPDIGNPDAGTPDIDVPNTESGDATGENLNLVIA